MAAIELHSLNENSNYTINTDHIQSIRKSIAGGSIIKFRILDGTLKNNEITVIEPPEMIINYMNDILICDLVK